MPTKPSFFKQRRPSRLPKGFVCPSCGGGDFERMHRREYRDVFFVVSAPHRCVTCDCIVEYPASLLLCALSAVFAVAMLVGFVIESFVPAIRLLIEGRIVGPLVVLLITVLGAGSMIWIVVVAARTARYTTAVCKELKEHRRL